VTTASFVSRFPAAADSGALSEVIGPTPLVGVAAVDVDGGAALPLPTRDLSADERFVLRMNSLPGLQSVPERRLLQEEPRCGFREAVVSHWRTISGLLSSRSWRHGSRVRTADDRHGRGWLSPHDVIGQLRFGVRLSARFTAGDIEHLWRMLRLTVFASDLD
jgi:hypothetical protein